MSSSFQRVGFHMRGDWLNTWIASQPISTPRAWAFTSPPGRGYVGADQHAR